MKKLALVIVCFLFAGYAYSNHWTPGLGYYSTMLVNGVIVIDGVEQQVTTLEVGAFYGEGEEEEVRGSAYATFFPPLGKYMVSLTIKGREESNGEVITFKLYNAETNEELELDCLNTITYEADATIGPPVQPNLFEFSFKTPTPQPTTYELPITAWTTNGGYYLIASPVGEVSPANVTNMIPAEGQGDFDLYYFDQTKDLEWINIKDGETPLQPGKGYLYAREQGATLTFSGTPITGSPYQVELVYDENADLPGWNLIGNPFATQASLDRSYYKLNDDGSEVSATLESEAINAMQGVFVMASEPDPETGEVEPAVFSTSAKTSQNIALNLVRNDRSASLVDRAVVRFDEGGQLPKFMLDATNTRVYIPQDGANYAVANHNSDNNTAVSFKAKENGSYKLKVSVENLDLEYLHLIDNQTGTDVDLLATPSYTFDANTTDQADRFRLVYAETTGIDENNNFAYFNGKTWNVNNEGQATLQVMDITGRTISSQTISGNAELSLDQPAGVYVLRLINGNDTKVQKVVVK